MNLLYVTAICDCYKNPNFDEVEMTSIWSEAWLTMSFRLKNLKLLLDSMMPIVVFVEDRYVEYLTDVPSTATIIPFSLNDIDSYQKIVTSTAVLPSIRNEVKDTLEYLGLMNSKIDFLLMARNLNPDVENFCWIDCGIFKIVNDYQYAYDQMKAFQNISLSTAFLGPHGSAPMLDEPELITDGIYWRFLGGLFLIRNDSFLEIKELIDQTLEYILELSLVTWEVNIWAIVEASRPDLFGSYYAEHNDSMFNVPTEFIIYEKDE